MQRRRITVIIVTALLVALVTPASGQSKEDDIRRLMELTGSADLADQVMDQIIDSYSQMAPEAGNEFWQHFRAQIETDELIDSLIPVYNRHLSHEDIRGLIEFYSSELGRKITEVMPLVMQESMKAGERLGERWAREAVRMLRQEGYLDSTG